MTIVLVALLGLVAVLVAVAMPVRLLPTAALWIFVFVPVAYMDVPTLVGRFLTPAVALVFLWELRVLIAYRERRAWPTGTSILVALVVVVGLLASAATSTDVRLSAPWVIVAVVCLPGAVLASQLADPRTWQLLTTSAMWVTILLFLLAVTDLATGFNPYRAVYSTDVGDRQFATFRTSVSLGHPLTASMVLGTMGVIALFSVRRGRVALPLSAALCGFVGVALTASRSGVYAIGGGVVGAGLCAVVGGRLARRVQGVALLVVGLVAAVVVRYSPTLAARDDTSGALKSAEYRDQVWRNAILLWRERMSGYGPGTSARVYTAEFPDQQFENSVLQQLVSLGPWSLVLVLLVAHSLVRAARHGRTAACGALLTFIIASAGYNVLDLNPAVLVVASFALIGMWTPPAETGPSRSDDTPATDRVFPRATRRTVREVSV